MPRRKKYNLFGEFEIPRADNGRVTNEVLRNFWEKPEKSKKGLATASGCYIFGIRAARGIRPWYVGQATVTFKQECFTPDKRDRYDEVLANHRRGTPVLFLLARMTPKRGQFLRRLGDRDADWVEKLLIQHCLSANAKLLNVQGAVLPTEVVIHGLLNTPRGKPSKGAQDLRRLLNLT